MKTLHTILFAFILLLTSCYRGATPEAEVLPPVQDVIDNVSKSTVMLFTKTYQDPEMTKRLGTGYGTGSIIKREGRRIYILTAGHLVHEAKIRIKGRPVYISAWGTLDKTSIIEPVQIQRILEPCDAAVVSMDLPSVHAASQVKVLPVSTDPTRVGDEVIVIGHPSSTWNYTTFARVAGVCGVNADCLSCNHEGNGFLLDRPSFPGGSGSPVVNLLGEQVGVLTEGFAFAIGVSQTLQVSGSACVGMNGLEEFLQGYIPYQRD